MCYSNNKIFFINQEVDMFEALEYKDYKLKNEKEIKIMNDPYPTGTPLDSTFILMPAVWVEHLNVYVHPHKYKAKKYGVKRIMKTSAYIRNAAKYHLKGSGGLCRALKTYFVLNQSQVCSQQLDMVRLYIDLLFIRDCGRHCKCIFSWYERMYEKSLSYKQAYKIRLQWAEWIAKQYEAIGD
jgi:hypothetical protein